MTNGFKTSQVARIVGFRTPMMVDYLARTDVIRPSILATPGRGRSRIYSFGDLVLLRAIKRLLEGGVQVAKIKQAMVTLGKQFSDLGPESRIEKYLITDGKDVFLHNDPSHLVELNKDGQFAFAFLVDIHAAQAHVNSACSSASATGK